MSLVIHSPVYRSTVQVRSVGPAAKPTGETRPQLATQLDSSLWSELDPKGARDKIIDATVVTRSAAAEAIVPGRSSNPQIRGRYAAQIARGYGTGRSDMPPEPVFIDTYA